MPYFETGLEHLSPPRIWASGELLTSEEIQQVLDWFLTEDKELNLLLFWREMETELQNWIQHYNEQISLLSDKEINQSWKNYLDYIKTTKGKTLETMTHKQVYTHARKTFEKMYYSRMEQRYFSNWRVAETVVDPKQRTGYMSHSLETIFSDEWNKKMYNTKYEDMK